MGWREPNVLRLSVVELKAYMTIAVFRVISARNGCDQALSFSLIIRVFSEGGAVSTDQQVELGTVSACPLSRREPDCLRAGLVSCNLGYSCAL